MKTKRQRFWAGLGIILLVLLAGYIAIRPLHLRWGASDADVARAMPGDLDGRRWTRAITINAAPEQIWPWLVQWGQGRGGWYSYDWLENLLGFDIHTADRILPEHQNPQIGDPICMTPDYCGSYVSVIVPNQWFGWQTPDAAGRPVWTFVLGLFPVDGARTRLVVRESFASAAMPPAALLAIEGPDAVMELKALNTVKQRAEGHAGSDWVTLYEIAAWLGLFVLALAAFVRMVREPEWRRPLAVAVASTFALLLVTFLLPPLWLRGVLALGLLAALLLKPRGRSSHPSTATPWLMLFARTALFLGAQALFAAAFALTGSDQAWEAGANWWPLAVALADLVCLLLLVRIFRAEGQRYWGLLSIHSATLGRDLLAVLGLTVLVAPLSYLPNIWLGQALFGSSEATLDLIVRPLPVWAVYAALVLFPLGQGVTELPAYFGYITPRLEAQGVRTWLAVALPALMLGLQHVAAPLLFDARFITWRALMFIPFALVTGAAFRWRPRLLPYFIIVHILMNMSFVAMFFNAAY